MKMKLPKEIKAKPPKTFMSLRVAPDLKAWLEEQGKKSGMTGSRFASEILEYYRSWAKPNRHP